MKIYVASSWRNPSQPGMVALLKVAGHEVYDFRHPKPGDNGFHWEEIDPDWRSWTPEKYREALSHPIAQEGYYKDMDAMEWANACVFVQPCGRSAHSEAGWFAGRGVPVIVLLAEGEEPELMYKMYNHLAIRMSEVVEWLEGLYPDGMCEG